ncbi:hypothetical protein ZMO02_17350 [Zymomonas mobilis subsp. pomaceae]|nr:hypothetical protein ZMO02_17350 [Zymomonas mobilis subsp. pomaceae]
MGAREAHWPDDGGSGKSCSGFPQAGGGRALEITRPLWGLPTAEMTGPEIAKRAGILVASLIIHLSPRRKAQKKAQKER